METQLSRQDTFSPSPRELNSHSCRMLCILLTSTHGPWILEHCILHGVRTSRNNMTATNWENQLLHNMVHNGGTTGSVSDQQLEGCGFEAY